MLKRLSSIREIISTAAVLLFASLPAIAYCQGTPAQGEEQAPSEPIEEITVYGEKTLFHWKLELFRAEDKVFEIFNALNDDDEYDVRCYRYPTKGTRVHGRHCKANYVREAEGEEAMGFMLGQPHVPSRTVIMGKHKKLIEKMDRLISEHPELLEAVVEYAAAIENMEGARKEKCEGRIIACSK